MWAYPSKQILPSTLKNIEVQLMTGFSWSMICYVIVNPLWGIFSWESLASDLPFGTDAGIL